MRRIIFALLIILFASMLTKCGNEPPPHDYYGGMITSIKFGTDWDSVNDTLLNTGTSFNYGIDKVYYEIKFQGPFYKGAMVKKVWRLPNSQTLEATSFIPKDSKRICGELHYYDLREMDAGKYEILIYYFAEGGYKPYDLVGVNRSFTIQ